MKTFKPIHQSHLKKRAVYTLFALILFIMPISLGGCSFNKERVETPPTAVSIAIGPHACSRLINFSNPVFIDNITEAVTSNGFASVVSIDGQPDLIFGESYDIPESLKSNPKKLQSDARQKANSILAELSKIQANDPETDTLSGLTLAVRSLASAPSNSIKRIIFADTGLSTSGILKFQKNLFDADPKTIADMLMEKKAIPNFEGITVYLLQTGDVASPQSELSSAQVEKLKAIWQAIIERTGGTVVISDVVARPGSYPSDQLPHVSTIDLPHDSFDPGMTVFNTQRIAFVGDSAEYVDAAVVRETLLSAAEYITNTPNYSALLVGTTAGDGDTDFCKSLSTARANAVLNTLVNEMGVPANQVSAVGLGSEDPWHIPDTDKNGNLIEEYATQNRKVVLLDANSEEASKVKAH